MKIQKELLSKIERDYLFVEATLDMDTKYLIDKIEQGINRQDNLNYKTNVKGKQTTWDFFLNDKEFSLIMFHILNYLDESPGVKLKGYLSHAWGVKQDLGDFTMEHTHQSHSMSGIIYLNDHEQKLLFPEINQEIIPRRGKIVLFSPFLKHYTKRNLSNKSKYAISFNFSFVPVSLNIIPTNEEGCSQ
tara:strand:- start:59 stop:622 length:564 start_codon:yes stop_codon:yes gene_type:complete